MLVKTLKLSALDQWVRGVLSNLSMRSSNFDSSNVIYFSRRCPPECASYAYLTGGSCFCSATSIQDYCITLTTPNSTQINTSRQCMLKSIHVTTDWHLAHVPNTACTLCPPVPPLPISPYPLYPIPPVPIDAYAPIAHVLHTPVPYWPLCPHYPCTPWEQSPIGQNFWYFLPTALSWETIKMIFSFYYSFLGNHKNSPVMGWGGLS